MKKYNKIYFFFALISIFLLSSKITLAAGTYSAEGIAFYAQAIPSAFTAEGTAFYAYDPTVAKPIGATNIYRFYNATSGDHFYTSSTSERDSLINNPQWGYVSEGTAFFAYDSTTTQPSEKIDVFRFYNTISKDHFYTASTSERDSLINNPQWGYVSEGTAFFAYSSQTDNTSPIYRFYNLNTRYHFYTASESEKNNISQISVYRFYNKTTGDHFYTASESEKGILENNQKSGYLPEGIAFYAYNTQISGTSPIYRFYNLNTRYHFYTASESEKDSLIADSSSGYKYEAVVFYAYTNQASGTYPIYRFVNSIAGDHFYTISESERNYLLKTYLGPEISVGLWGYSKEDIQSQSFQITANKAYNIRDNNGNILAQIAGNTPTKVTYDANGNLKIYSSLPDTLVATSVTFDSADGDNTSIIFDTNRPNSSYDRYRGKMKVQYYRGIDIINGAQAGSSNITQIWIVNTLPLELYIWGEGETTGTGPIEHTKVMTTMFRTYGFWYIKYANKYAPLGFKIRSDSGSQIYWGYDREVQYPNVRKAAEATRGILATYGNDVALTPYSSWSDGRTRSWQERWGGTSYPWCKSVQDPYGKNSSQSTAQLEASGNHMVGLIANGSLKLGNSGWKFDQILKYYYTGIALLANY